MTPHLTQNLITPQLSFFRGSMVRHVTILENHREYSPRPLFERSCSHSSHFLNLGATLHNLNLVTYIVNSYIKATSTIRPQDSIVRSSHIHT